jgi:hypothetical protein
MKKAALAAAAAAARSETDLAPVHSVLASSGLPKGSAKDFEAVALAAAAAAASASRFGGASAPGGAFSRALPHPGIRALHTAGLADGASLGGLGAPVAVPSTTVGASGSSSGAIAGAGVKRPRGRQAPGGAVELAGGERAPLVSGRGDGVASAPRGWFDLPAPELTLELKRELTILRNRNFLDPTRRYKTSREDRGALPKFFQIGTVVEGATERHAGTRARSKPSLVATLQADPVFNEYASRTMENIRHRQEGGGLVAYKAKKAAAGAAWKKHLKEFKGNKKAAKGKKRLY